VELTIEDILAAISVVIIAATIILVVVNIPRLKALWPGFKKYRHLLATLVSRDIKVKYRRSVLGLLWSVLQPLFFMLIITLVFANVFKLGIRDYPVFYITGFVVFSFVSESTTLSLNSILGNASLIKKVYIPKYIFPLQKCLFALVNMVFSLIAVAIVYIILQVQVYPTVFLLVVVMAYAAVFSFGLSLILSAAVMFLRDVAHLYGIWVTAWMYLTPILYPLSILPEPVQNIVKLNPLVYYVEYARSVMIDGVIPDLNTNLICIGFALLTLIIGLVFFKRTQDRFILHM